MKVKHLFLILILLLEALDLYYIFEGEPAKDPSDFPLYEFILVIYVGQALLLTIIIIIVILEYLRDNWDKTLFKIKDYES